SIASAQVKSCWLIAGMYASGITAVTEPVKSRDHTENMLKGFGCELKVDGLRVEITAQPQLTAQDITVPADISSAAFFLVLGLCKQDSIICIKNLCLNPSRDGILKILRLMGGNITVKNRRLEAGEFLADVTVESSKLNGIEIPVELIPSAIDEFPILFIAAARSSGTTTLRQATELRHKESDRIAVMIKGLKTLGIDCDELVDGAVIHGGELQSGYVDAHGDHRCAMSFLIAGALSADKKIIVTGTENIKTSFPGFLSLAKKIGVKVHHEVPVISIDGPSGVGKGTISALVAERLGFHLLDSGSIYRALAYKALKDNIELDDIDTLVHAAENLDLKFKTQVNQLTQIYLDEQLVNEELRTEKCGDTASMIAPIKAVRGALLQRQREFCQTPGLVADGRDMGTVVFKNSCLKIFLTASAKKRAQRRFNQLINKGVDVNIHDLFRDIEKRDARDSSRKVAPLVPAKDAIEIDTSDMSIEEVLNKVMYHVKHRLKLN
ncbi:MAG: (d)CMP kinase, partial [Proteobacteria bacterium]|nr:(d)CMP kinase [Pseudomonadota bacterium]